MLIFATGACKDSHILALEGDYLKRLKKPWAVEVRELKASKLAEPLRARAEEAGWQLAALKGLGSGYVPILLHEHARAMDTLGFQKMVQGQLDGGRVPVFVIGGAAGFDASVLDVVPLRVSLSAMTFPHQLCRVMLAEQVYRAFTLSVGHPYHRA